MFTVGDGSLVQKVLEFWLLPIVLHFAREYLMIELGA